MKDHACAAPGCTVQVAGYMLACGRHWMALPPPLRSQINDAWQRRRRHPSDDAAVGAHLELIVDAVAVWSAR